MLDHVTKIKARAEELEKLLQSSEVVLDRHKLQALSQEYSDLKEKLALAQDYEKVANALGEAEKTKAESQESEMVEFAEAEIKSLSEQKENLEKALKRALLPTDPNDSKNIIMEIRAGAGGDESTLFAAELYRLYTRLAEDKGWQTNIMSANRIGIGGYKEVIFEIKGKNVYSTLKFESGVHRVQRVPDTEKAGRVHTSTATVVVMPEAESIDIDIDPAEIKMEVTTARGHGGQSVNTTYSAVRLTHLPTGITVSCQDERSQTQNREKGMLVMRTRVLAHKLKKPRAESSATRQGQIGSGDRSEKIRTYNFTQDRLTDHRLQQNWHNLPTIMDGKIHNIISALQDEDAKEKLRVSS